MNNKKKIAFVIQRYGKEINGGSEVFCKQLAERLIDYYDIEVLTTCAIDYVTWKNEYSEGTDYVDGINVKRFPVDKPRNQNDFTGISNRVLNTKHYIKDEIEWMEKQGPYCPKLIDYINRSKHLYDGFVFFTYLYYTAYFGLQQVPEKSILISTAHDEPPIYLNIFYPYFHLPRAIIFLTEEEREFVQKKFNNSYIPSDVIGIGIEVPEKTDADSFRKKHGLHDDFILYVGRIDESKGCKELFDFFIRYKNEKRSNLKLVLMGKSVMDVPTHKDIIPLGFVSDEDKYNGMSAAKLSILPSKFESFSISVLESLALGIPVLVNGSCEVLKGHCIRSNAGLYYTNYEEFKSCLNILVQDESLITKMGKNGKKYAKLNYNWSNILKKYEEIIDKLL